MAEQGTLNPKVLGSIPSRGTLFLACLVALVFAGCGGGGDQPPDLPYHQWFGEGNSGGVVITLHGGAWRLTGERAAATVEPIARDLAGQGYEVLNGTYPPGRDGIEGVEALYELAKQRAGDRGVCAYGQSAGGSWALELAIKHPELRCVVAEAPPTDLEALARVSPAARRALTGVFGSDLAAHSPIRGPFARSTRILIAGTTTDKIVSWSQAERFAARWRNTELVPIAPGHARFVHAFASAAALRAYEAIRNRFLRRAL